MTDLVTPTSICNPAFKTISDHLQKLANHDGNNFWKIYSTHFLTFFKIQESLDSYDDLRTSLQWAIVVQAFRVQKGSDVLYSLD
jgi:hypothetical protein